MTEIITTEIKENIINDYPKYNTSENVIHVTTKQYQYKNVSLAWSFQH
jgi:hypothetical protein